MNKITKPKTTNPKQTKEVIVTPKKTESYVGRFQHIFNKHYTIDEINRYADDLYEWFEIDIGHYKIMDWMLQPEIMLNKARLSDFCKRSEYFNFVYNQVKSIQEARLIDYLNVSDKPTALIFMLKNMSKWRDNPEPEDNINTKQEGLSFVGW